MVVAVGFKGGKVALAYLEGAAAGTWAERYFGLLGAPRSVWTLDTVPGPVERNHATGGQDHVADKGASVAADSVALVLAAVAAVRMPAATKAGAAVALEQLGCSRATAQWMTTNLRPVKSGGFDFVFELATCQALFEDYAVRDFVPLVQAAAEGDLDCSIDVVT